MSPSRFSARLLRTSATPTSSATSDPCASSRSGCADAAVAWREQDGLSVGCDRSGAPACVLLMNAPTRLLEARELIAAAVAA